MLSCDWCEVKKSTSGLLRALNVNSGDISECVDSSRAQQALLRGPRRVENTMGGLVSCFLTNNVPHIRNLVYQHLEYVPQISVRPLLSSLPFVRRESVL